MRLTRWISAVAFAAASFGVVAEQSAPNIIYIVGDGMGFEYISAYRYAYDDPNHPGLSATEFDDLLRGSATTYPDDDTLVTDSAAGATALSTGTKSYNGAIAVDPQHNVLQTLMQKARDHGWSTGAVVTSQVNHATPAAFFTHNVSRRNYDAIADEMATQTGENQWSFDVMLGGGLSYFKRNDKDWISVLQNQGMTVVTDFADLTRVQQTPVLGLFAPVGLPHAIDDDVNRLAYMTSNALRLLSAKDKPFALLIEGSQIDWCGHANDIACAVHEMDSLNRTLRVVREFRQQHPNTILVVTADHSTGGLTLGRDGEYAWFAQRVMKINASIEVMTADLLGMPGTEWKTYLQKQMPGLALNADQWQQLLAPAGIKDAKARKAAISDALVAVTADVTGTGWTTHGHTGVDVPVLAAGPTSEQLQGYMNNTDIAHHLRALIR